MPYDVASLQSAYAFFTGTAAAASASPVEPSYQAPVYQSSSYQPAQTPDPYQALPGDQAAFNQANSQLNAQLKRLEAAARTPVQPVPSQRPQPQAAPSARPPASPINSTFSAPVRAALEGRLAGRHGGQCKVFVERQFRARFPNNISAKSMIRPANHPGFAVVREPRPGDIFVSGHGQWGHTGIVKAVHPDGSLTVVDSNHVRYETVGTHDFSARYVRSFMLGYLRPDGQPTLPYWRRALTA